MKKETVTQIQESDGEVQKETTVIEQQSPEFIKPLEPTTEVPEGNTAV